MEGAGRIVRLDPEAAIEGGEVSVECERYDTSSLRRCRALFGGQSAHLVGASPHRVLVAVPESEGGGGEVALTLESDDGLKTNAARLVVGKKLAEDLHIVANPAFDPDDNSLYLTRSGSRGQRLPTTMFRLDPGGELMTLHGEIANPTGIAFSPDGEMFVSSRADGTVYRVRPFGEAVPFARNLGIATGLAFDREGRLYVGDRTGTIHRVNRRGAAEEWASLEPSVAAYHLAFGPDGALYVTGATVSSYESITRIDELGRSSVFFRGLGRPHGLAFDREGNLYVAASLRGRRGVVRIGAGGGGARLFVAGVNVVGLAFGAAGEMIVATNEAVHSLPLGIRGTLLG